MDLFKIYALKLRNFQKHLRWTEIDKLGGGGGHYSLRPSKLIIKHTDFLRTMRIYKLDMYAAAIITNMPFTLAFTLVT